MWFLSFCVKSYHHSELVLKTLLCQTKVGYSSHTKFTRNYHSLIPCPTYPSLHTGTVPRSLRMVPRLPPFFPRLHAPLFWITNWFSSSYWESMWFGWLWRPCVTRCGQSQDLAHHANYNGVCDQAGPIKISLLGQELSKEPLHPTPAPQKSLIK